MIKNKKAATDVVLLVFMAVILSSWALFTFISNSNAIGSQVKDVRFLDNFYVKEDSPVVNKSIRDINLRSASGASAAGRRRARGRRRRGRAGPGAPRSRRWSSSVASPTRTRRGACGR